MSSITPACACPARNHVRRKGCSSLPEPCSFSADSSAVLPTPIYVREGNCYTSAGVTAGIDLSLSLVEQDLGRSICNPIHETKSYVGRKALAEMVLDQNHFAHACCLLEQEMGICGVVQDIHKQNGVEARIRIRNVCAI